MIFLTLKILYIKKAIQSAPDSDLLAINVPKTQIHLICRSRDVIWMHRICANKGPLKF
jgi:hypothetical protein